MVWVWVCLCLYAPMSVLPMLMRHMGSGAFLGVQLTKSTAVGCWGVVAHGPLVHAILTIFVAAVSWTKGKSTVESIMYQESTTIELHRTQKPWLLLYSWLIYTLSISIHYFPSFITRSLVVFLFGVDPSGKPINTEALPSLLSISSKSCLKCSTRFSQRPQKLVLSKLMKTFDQASLVLHDCWGFVWLTLGGK